MDRVVKTPDDLLLCPYFSVCMCIYAVYMHIHEHGLVLMCTCVVKCLHQSFPTLLKGSGSLMWTVGSLIQVPYLVILSWRTPVFVFLVLGLLVPTHLSDFHMGSGYEFCLSVLVWFSLKCLVSILTLCGFALCVYNLKCFIWIKFCDFSLWNCYILYICIIIWCLCTYFCIFFIYVWSLYFRCVFYIIIFGKTQISAGC